MNVSTHGALLTTVTHHTQDSSYSERCLPSPFMAFLRVWASSTALNPEAAFTVPPLVA